MQKVVAVNARIRAVGTLAKQAPPTEKAILRFVNFSLLPNDGKRKNVKPVK